MVTESSLSNYALSSDFVQKYALGTGLLEDRIPESDIVITAPMVVLIDALIRTQRDSLPFEQLEAGTGLGTSDLRSAIDKCEEENLVRLESGGVQLNKDSEVVEAIIEVHETS